MTLISATNVLKTATAAAFLMIATQGFAQTDAKISNVAMNIPPQLSLPAHSYHKINYCPSGCYSSLDCRQCAGYRICHYPQGSTVGICSDR